MKELAIYTTGAETMLQNRADYETLFSRFIAFIDVKPKSTETYSKAVKQFLLYMKDNGILEPTRQDVIRYRDTLAKDHKPATVQLYLTAVKLFFKWLHQEGFINSNIAEKVKAPKQDKNHKKSYLTDSQAARVLQTASGLRDYALLSVMLTTGIRTIEASRANIEDLDTIGGQAVLYIQGKGKDDRREYVKLADPVETAIRNYLQSRKDARPTDPLFTSESRRDIGGRLTTRSISRIAKETMIAAGYNSERLTAHSLRHTAAHLNLENGGTVEETRELLRHANVETTYIYINEMNRERNQSEQRIAAAIFKGI